MYQVVTPQTDEQLKRYYQLRWTVLRKPFQRPLGSEQDAYDQVGHHRMVVDKHGQPIAVGRVHFNSPEEAQIRFMAVDPEYQGQGHGVAIVYALELAARNEGAQHVVINSRDNTLGFYKKCGYQVVEEGDTVSNSMAEHQLRKSFSKRNYITYRPDWVAELQQTWQQRIPISDAMGIKIHQYTGRILETRANLSRNINVHDTMFAGSIYSLGTLTCWGLLHLQLLEREVKGSVVLAEGNIKYQKPLRKEPRGIALLNDVEGDFSALKQGRNAHLTLRAQLFSREQPVAEFTGRFVVLAPRD